MTKYEELGTWKNLAEKMSKSEQANGIITRCIAHYHARYRKEEQYAPWAIACMDEVPTQHRTHDGPLFWAISNAFWYDLMAIKRHTLEFFRGSAIGDWIVRFATLKVYFGAHLKPGLPGILMKSYSYQLIL